MTLYLGYEFASSIRTPMSYNVKLCGDPLGKTVDSTLYGSMIGILLYRTASRPDICFSVDVCARFQTNPMEYHLIVVKFIIKFVNPNNNFGILFDKDRNDVLAENSNADWATNANDRNSNSGGYFYLKLFREFG